MCSQVPASIRHVRHACRRRSMQDCAESRSRHARLHTVAVEKAANELLQQALARLGHDGARQLLGGVRCLAPAQRWSESKSGTARTQLWAECLYASHVERFALCTSVVACHSAIVRQLSDIRRFGVSCLLIRPYSPTSRIYRCWTGVQQLYILRTYVVAS